MHKIRFNKVSQNYEYRLPGMAPIPLRTDSMELVNDENFEQFIASLAHTYFEYPFDKRIELANVPKQTDYKLTGLYSESVILINEKNYSEAADMLDRLENIYPQLLYYSDIAFLKGYNNLQRGQFDDAKTEFKNFLKFSSKKYSTRFRNYRYFDMNDHDWLLEKKYAQDFLSGKPLPGNTDFIKEIRPKYYYSSLQPGFTLNADALAERPGGLFSLSLGTDHMSDFSAGVQYYRNIVKSMDVNAEFSFSGNMWEARMAVPLQLFLSGNNRFGIKMSPFGQYNKLRRIRSGGERMDVNEVVYNFGVKTSVGLFIVQRLALGAYYTYNYYNEDRPFAGSESSNHLFWDNEYDVSLYYPVFKDLNLKAGIKSGDWVAGIYLPGWEVSFNLNDQEIILRTQMY